MKHQEIMRARCFYFLNFYKDFHRFLIVKIKILVLLDNF